MACAELGRFEEAIRWQLRVVSQEQKMRAGVSRERQKRFELYEQGRPVRAPWLDG